MNTKKNYWRLLTTIIAAILTMSIVSCGDDDESSVDKDVTSNDSGQGQGYLSNKGSCGSNLTYSFDEVLNELRISGTGRMNDYTDSNQPWHDFSISYIVIEEGCTYVGRHAFHNLKYKVKKIYLADSMQEIGDYAFCDLLIDNLYLPTDIVKIGNYAFSDCTLLKGIEIKDCNALTTIGEYAFGFCPIKMNNLTLPKNVKTIGGMVFFSSTFSGLTLNDKLESVGNGCFGNLNVSKLEIPNSVKHIGAQAFRGTFSEIRIGTGLGSMGEIPFVSTKSGKMYVNLGKPISFSNATYTYIIGNTSGGNATSSWTLYVPKGSKSAYQNAIGWKSFKSIIEDALLVSGNGTPQSDDDNDNQDDVEKDSYGIPVTYQYPITYYIDNQKFKTVLVEDGPYGDFYMMQTEFPARGEASISIDTYDSGTPDDGKGNKDGVMIKYELRKFLEDLRKNTGIPFRLPTKDEWQYAAKGGNKSSGFKYSGSNYIDEVAWYSGNSENKYHDAALKIPNELGLYDMSGNFDELCSENSRYNSYYAKNTDIMPSVDGPMCGGNWKDAASNCTVNSWKEGSTMGNIGLTGISEKNAVNAYYLGLRLVYSKTIK